MSLEDLLKEKCKEDFECVDDVEELILDNLAKVEEISTSDKEFLEKFQAMTHLSLNYLGLESIENFPALSSLTHVWMNDNKIEGGLELLVECKKLKKIYLENCLLSDYENLRPLVLACKSELAELRRLEIRGTPMAAKPEYRKAIFDLLPNLKTIDGVKRDREDAGEEKSVHVQEKVEEPVTRAENTVPEVLEPDTKIKKL